jgi:hypothetical protein
MFQFTPTGLSRRFAALITHPSLERDVAVSK